MPSTQPTPPRERVQLYLEPKQIEKVRKAAKKAKVSMSELFRQIIKVAFEKK